MSAVILIALLAAAFSLQYLLDARGIALEASQRGWSDAGVSWAPFGGGWFMRSRSVRSYWLCYRDERGRSERSLVLVSGQRFTGTFDLVFEPMGVPVHGSRPSPRSHTATRGPASPSGRLLSIALWAFIGLWIGCAIGIGLSFLIHPGSNVAPAYGVIYVGPLGLVAGALFGAMRRR